MHRRGVVVPDDQIHLRTSAFTQSLLDDVHEPSPETVTALIRTHRDVIEPSAPPVPAAERRCRESAFVLREQEQPRVAGRERGERDIVIAWTDPDTTCFPEGAHRGAVLLAELAHVHFSILPLVRVGRFQVEIFSDGIFRLDGGLMYGIVPKPLWEKEQPADDRNRVALDMNCLLIRDGAGNVVVVETGAGPKLSERSKANFGIDEPPRLLDELARRGVRPDEVTLVVNTHLHFDHSGGNTYRDGDKVVATFPRASYVFQRLEWIDANAPNERTRGSYFADDFAPLEAAGKLELIDESVEILPGIRLDRIQGHTRGTQTVRVTDAGATLFFSSDFMPDRHHLRLPWIPAIDLFPLETLAAKKVILPRAVSEKWIVGFTHDVPRFGRISEQDGKLRFEEVAE